MAGKLPAPGVGVGIHKGRLKTIYERSEQEKRCKWSIKTKFGKHCFTVLKCEKPQKRGVVVKEWVLKKSSEKR